jgi:nucleoporin SEH1
MATGPTPGYLSRAHTVALATPTQTHVTLDAASASLVSHALQQGLQQQQQQQQQQGATGATGPTGAQSRSGLGNREADGGWCISWCKDRYWGEIIAAGCGINGLIKVLILHLTYFFLFFNYLFFKIIQLNARRSSTILTLNSSPPNIPTSSGVSATINTSSIPSTESTGPPTPNPSNPNPTSTPTPSSNSNIIETNVASAITSVSWAPSCGRSYHLVATGARDGHLRIWKIKPGSEDLDNAEGLTGDSESEEIKWTAALVADFNQHK